MFPIMKHQMLFAVLKDLKRDEFLFKNMQTVFLETKGITRSDRTTYSFKYSGGGGTNKVFFNVISLQTDPILLSSYHFMTFSKSNPRRQTDQWTDKMTY